MSENGYLARWPQYIPLPHEITRSTGAVPNAQSVDWPQAQFAPLYLRPGSSSVQPYRYPKDGPLTRVSPLRAFVPSILQPEFQVRAAGPTSGTGRSGDMSATPGDAGYGGVSGFHNGYGSCGGCGSCYGCLGDASTPAPDASSDSTKAIKAVAAVAIVATAVYLVFLR